MTAVAAPEPSVTSVTSGVDTQNPWLGLVSFTEKQRAYFHGRSEEADELLRRVERTDLTVLFGQSGLGKSSLLQAGLFPRLRAEGYLPVAIRLDHAASAPPLSQQVKEAVARAVADAGGRSENAAADAGDSLWEYFHRRGLRLETHDGEPVRLVLVLDQFEELFAIGQASDATRARASTFLTELADLIENRVPEALERRIEESPELVRQFAMGDRGYRSLICLREDYLPHLESVRRVMPSVAENRMRLTRMSGLRALEAVVNPAGDLITAEVGRQVVRFVAGAETREPARAHADGEDEALAKLEVEPSLLSLVCRELNNRRLALGLPQITADLLAGNRERILQDFYERCVADHPPAVRAFVEDELVTDSGLRENMALERARKLLTQRGGPAEAIDDLVKLRLLHLEERLDIRRVELTHDVLTSVVKKSRDARQQQEATLRAEQCAQEVREKARRQRRRLRLIVAAMAVALAVVTSFGAESYYLYRVSKERLQEVKRQQERADAGEQKAHQARKEAEVVKEVFDRATLPVTEEENIRHLPELSAAEERLASIRLESLQSLVQKMPDDSSLEAKVARAHAILGMISTYVGSFRRADENLRQAAELYGRLAKKYPESLAYRLGECRAQLELGWLYWDDKRTPAARRWYQQALEKLEREYARSPNDPEICYELGTCLVRLGGALPDNTTRENRQKLATRAIRLFKRLTHQKHREVDSRVGLSVATYRLTMAQFDGKDQQGLLKSLEDISTLDEASLKLAPESPHANSFRVFTHHDRANALVRLGKPKEALAEREAAVARARAIVKQSPEANRWTSILAEALNKLGPDLRRLQRTADAQAAFEESCRLTDELVRRFPDRGFLASQWVEFRNDLADFFEYGPKKPQGEIQAQQDLLRTLDLTAARGREMAARFPDHHWLQVEFAKTLGSRGRYYTQANRNEEALPDLLGSVEVYRSRVLADKNSWNPDDITTYLNHLQAAASCASSLEKGEEVVRLSRLALEVRSHCTSREGADDLGTVLVAAAKFHRAAGHHPEAIRAYRQAIEIRRPALEKAPWHWYLEDHLGGSYMHLADTYHEIKDFRNEVLANREYLKTLIGPRYGAKIGEYTDPSRPTDKAEADRIRQFIKTSTAGGMKRFTVPCDIGGVKYPFHVYVTNVPWPKHPLEDQARWLREERGGTIPKEVMDSFKRLQNIAHENKVSFVDLCVYALGTATAENAKQLEIEKTGGPSQATGSLTPPGKSAPDPLADMKARLVDLKTKLDNSPGDLSTTREAAQVYDEFGQRRLSAKQVTESVEALRESVRLREMLARVRPTEKEHRQKLVATLLFLGKAHYQLKAFDAAYNCFHRRLDLLEQFQLETPSEKQEAAIAEGYLLFGELAEVRGDRADALRWYARAAQQKNSQAPRKVATLLQLAPELADLLPAKLKAVYVAVYVRMQREGKSTSAADFVNNYVLEFEKSQKEENGRRRAQQIAQLRELAAQCADLAEAYEARGRQDAYRKALAKEFDIRGQQIELEPKDQALQDVRASLAGKIARSYLASKRMKEALEWMTRAAALADVDTLLQLADWCEKGTHVKVDVKRANQYRYRAYVKRGYRSFGERRYKEALPDLEKVCALEQADAEDHNKLGVCYGKLGQWESAIKAYTRSIELDLKSEAATDNLFNLLEAMIITGHPDELFQVLRTVEKKGWKLPKAGPNAARYGALHHGFRAMALRMGGKDATEAERAMRQFIARRDFKAAGWTWDELNEWLKTTKLAPDRKYAVEEIIAQLSLDEPRLKNLAKHYGQLAEAYKAKGQLGDCRNAMLKEFGVFDLLRLQRWARSGSAEAAAVARKIGGHYLESKETRHGIGWFARAADLNDLESMVLLAEWYEKGIHVRVDVKKAVEAYQRIGKRAMGLDRPGEAVAPFKKAAELAKGIHESYWPVLDMLEAMICADRGADVLHFLGQMEEKKWDPTKQTAQPHTVEAYLTAFRAIALHQAGKDASDAEKRLAALLARPNLRVTRSTAIQLDRWPKKAKLPPGRVAAVAKIIQSIDSRPSRVLTTPFFPLEVGPRYSTGTLWVYRSSTREPTHIRVATRERVGERECYRLETLVNGTVSATERVAVENDGVYRQSQSSTEFSPPVRILALPPKDKEGWEVKSRGGLLVLIGKATTRVEDVTVPAGKYPKAIAVEMKTRRWFGETTTTTWYAKGVGPVKIVRVEAGKTTTLELERYAPPAPGAKK
jgi:tetratricopeptide (TPR) repeat protein